MENNKVELNKVQEQVQEPAKKKSGGFKRFLVVMFSIWMLKSCMSDEDVEKKEQVKAQEPKTEQVQEEPKKEEVEKEEPVKQEVQYTTEKVFIHDDPNTYSGKHVYEITVRGQFDLNSPTLKQDALKILKREAEIGLKEQRTSVMVRVFIYQGQGYDYSPIAVGTFDVAGSNLTLRELQDKARFPIFNQLNK